MSNKLNSAVRHIGNRLITLLIIVLFCTSLWQLAAAGWIQGKAIVALMRKLAKGLWHQGRGEPFVIDKLFAAPPMGAC